MPVVKSWADRYHEKGLTVIGVHSPEFDEERNVEHLRREVTSLVNRYPVVTDNDYQTWNAYKVEAWPTVFRWTSRDEFAGGVLAKGIMTKPSD